MTISNQTVYLARSYWAKDLIFVISDVGYFGIQAWLNSYFDIESNYIQSDNLKARGLSFY